MNAPKRRSRRRIPSGTPSRRLPAKGGAEHLAAAAGLVAASSILGAFLLKIPKKRWVLGSGRFLRPTFAQGYGSILDFANSSTSFVVGDDPIEIDARAIASDWVMVGRDLRTAYAGIPRKQ